MIRVFILTAQMQGGFSSIRAGRAGSVHRNGWAVHPRRPRAGQYLRPGNVANPCPPANMIYTIAGFIVVAVLIVLAVRWMIDDFDEDLFDGEP
jgi:hypothetical protein